MLFNRSVKLFGLGKVVPQVGVNRPLGSKVADRLGEFQGLVEIGPGVSRPARARGWVQVARMLTAISNRSSHRGVECAEAPVTV